MSFTKLVLSLLCALTLVACDGSQDTQATNSLPPVVKVLPIEPAQQAVSSFSGTIEAERQNPLSFQIGGRVVARLVSAGDRVKQGQLLFELDKRDLAQAKRAADAQVAAARQAVATAKDELARADRLFKSRYVSEQARDQAQLRLTEAETRVDATESTARQAANALEYTQLTAPADGIVTETFVEAGQVVMPGQRVGEFAYDGQREIEVYLPQGFEAPDSATVQIDGQTFEATRREVSGAADRSSRTFRARYALPDAAANLPIGAIAELSVSSKTQNQVVSVTLGALDERGKGPRVWIVENGKAEPVAVEVVSLSIETALIKTDLPVGTPVVAMGTHLLKPGMAVRVQAR